MAVRYCGEARVRLAYRGADTYHCTVTCRGVSASLDVNAPAVGFGPGVAHDSPVAYDATARAALAFASYPKEIDDEGQICTALEGGTHVDETGDFVVSRRRSKHAQG